MSGSPGSCWTSSTRLTSARTSCTATRAGMSCPSSCARRRVGGRRCGRRSASSMPSARQPHATVRTASGDEDVSDGEELLVALDLDRERMVNSEQGRRGWLREGRHQLDELRRQQARPIARSRTERLEESKRRLEEEHRVELEANAAYEAYKARGVMRDGRRFGKPPKPYVPPAVPTGTINTTDHDSRIVRTPASPLARATTRRRRSTSTRSSSPQRSRSTRLTSVTSSRWSTRPNASWQAIGVSSLPETVVADPGYWHKQQMENVVSRGIQVLIPPDSGLRTDPRPGWNKGLYAFMRLVLSTDHGQSGLPKTDGHRRARVRADQAQPRVPAVPPTRTLRRALGVAIRSSDPQPVEAPHAPDRRHRGLKRRRRQRIRLRHSRTLLPGRRRPQPRQTICPTATSRGSSERLATALRQTEQRRWPSTCARSMPRHDARDARAETKASLGPRVSRVSLFATSREGDKHASPRAQPRC